MVHVGLCLLRCLGSEIVGLLGVLQRGDGVRAGNGKGVVQVALGLCKPGAGLSADAAAAGGDVVRRRADLCLGGHDALLQRGLGPPGLLLLVTNPGEGRIQRLVRRFDAFQGGNRINLAALDFGFDPGQCRFDGGYGSGQLGVLPGLDHGPGLGQVLGGVDDCRLQPAMCLLEVAGDLGDRVDEHIGLMKAFFSCPDGDGGEASFAGTELLPGRYRSILHKGEPLLGLADVVRNLGQGALGVLGAQPGEGLLGAGDPRFCLPGAGGNGGQGLRGVLFKLTQGIKVRLLLLQRGKG
ncbi:hypothetical protein BJQ89_00759 [Arthrobacter sp. ES1]|nr:hypothetical protein [Arthrobacter sp. ES1]